MAYTFRKATLVALAVLLSVSGCGSRDQSTAQPTAESSAPASSESPAPEASSATEASALIPPVTPAAEAPATTLSDAEIAYGVAPTRNSQVTYQPDVVIPEGGAKVVRSVSSNGLAWTIDASAPHADELVPGKIMFLTGRAVGRVLGLTRNGSDLAITLGPVELTDVIKEAHLSGNQAFDPSTMRAYSAPDWPGAEAEPIGAAPAPAQIPYARLADAQASFARFEEPQPNAPMMQLAQAAVPVPGLGPPKQIDMPKSTFNPFLGEGLGANFYFPNKNMMLAPVRAQGSLWLHMSKPYVTWDINITPRGIETAKLEVHGAAGLTIHFDASTSDKFTTNDNQKDQVLLPLDLSLPLGGPVPLAVTLHQEFSLRTAFSAKGSKFSATGDYSFEGSLTLECHYSSCKGSAPAAFTMKQSFIDSMSGLSLGVNGIVLAYEGRVIVGIGAFGFVTGPYIGYGVSVGATRGSDADPAQKCKQVDMKVWARVGVGYALPQVVTNVLNFFLRVFNKAPISSVGGPGVTTDVYKKGQRVGCGGEDQP